MDLVDARQLAGGGAGQQAGEARRGGRPDDEGPLHISRQPLEAEQGLDIADVVAGGDDGTAAVQEHSGQRLVRRRGRQHHDLGFLAQRPLIERADLRLVRQVARRDHEDLVERALGEEVLDHSATDGAMADDADPHQEGSE